MIEPMVKIEIVGFLEDLDETLDALQRTGTVQIEEIPTIEDSEHKHLHRIHLDETKEHLLSRYEELLSTVTELLDILSEGDEEDTPIDETKPDELHKLSPDELIDFISRISREVRRLARQRRNLLQDMESARQYETLINTFIPLLEKAGSVGELEQLGLILNKGESSILPILKNRVNEITGPETLFFHQQMPDGAIGVFIVVSPEDLPAVRELLGNEGVAEHHIPREFRKKNLKESIETIRSRIEDIPREIEKIDRTLLEKKKSNGELLRFIKSLSTDRLNQLRILSRLVRTRYTFVISGWTPASYLESLKKQLEENFAGRVYIDKVKMNELDFLHIPTLLSNRGVSRSFEILLKLLPPPKYGNLDATPFISIFFPIFFGVILGDMAYGFALLAIAGLIKWKSAKGSLLSDVGTVALTAGVFTVLFGFVFGEFLGDFGEHHFGLKPIAPWLHRSEAIESLLLIALGLGVIHIVFGFILKTYVSIIIRHTKGTIEGIAKIAVILGIVGIFVQLLVGFPLTVRYFSYAFIGLGLSGVLFSEGLIGILEIFSIFGNILSYSRIMAIGIASVILAIVANRLAESTNNIIAAVLIGFTIHLVNFVMGVFSPTIHSLRLHYVEFFGKFFQPSGKPFQPFKRIIDVRIKAKVKRQKAKT